MRPDYLIRASLLSFLALLCPGLLAAPDAGDCAALVDQHLTADQIGLPTSGALIRSARTKTDEAGSAYCELTGAIFPLRYTAPEIRFQLNLPDNWNTKTLHFGGGGFNGTVVTGTGHYTKQPESELTPLQRGYMTYGSDSGHQSAERFDGRFLLEPEALANFGHQQLKKVHDVAMWSVKTYYGRASTHNYFIGGSQGGHEAFDVVQRYADDYDGVVAAYPAHNLLLLHLSALRYARALMSDAGAGWLDPASAKGFVSHVYARCDPLDGLSDGIISNPDACYRSTSDLRRIDAANPLLCNEALNAAKPCLTGRQLQTLLTMNAEYRLPFALYVDDDHQAVFPRWTPFEGSTFFDGGFPNLGGEGPDQALQAMPAEATPRYAIAGDLAMDIFSEFDPLNYAARIRELAPMYTANSVDIDRFINAGGKLLFYHGAVDDFIPVHSSIDYFLRLRTRYGASRLDDSVRFYVIPGMGHVSGPFNARIPMLDTLEAWVERGVTPADLVAIEHNDVGADRTRPVCRYPAWPRYSGSGDPDTASSFICTIEKSGSE